jgi:hypothetical protein
MKDYIANLWVKIGLVLVTVWPAVACLGVGAFQVQRRRRQQ